MTPITRLEVFLNGIIYGGEVPEPITRIEVMLNDIKNGDVVTLTPITRGECYLARISGANVQIPEPVTRVEMYLAKKCGVDIVTPSPIVRIEHWLNAWASGEDPLVTLTGKIISFFSRAAKPFKSTSITIEPVQSGTGDPSPSNVRPISGWTGANIYDEAEYDETAQPKVTVQFGQTVYGGTATDNGDGSWTVVAALAGVDLGTLTWTYNAQYTRFQSTDLTDAKAPSANNVPWDAISSQFKAVAGLAVATTDGSFGMLTTKNLLVHDSRYTDAATFKTAMSGVQLVYELATPITFTVSGDTLETLVGTNNAWADTGNITAEVYGTPVT